MRIKFIEASNFPKLKWTHIDFDERTTIFVGAKPLSDNDRKKAFDGSETGINRTGRLLYVTFTLVPMSLALVAYAEGAAALANGVLPQGWFTSGEIVRRSAISASRIAAELPGLPSSGCVDNSFKHDHAAPTKLEAGY